MPKFPLTALFVISLSVPAFADEACVAEIQALFEGGGMDPFARPPMRQVLEVFGPDGNPVYTMDSIAVTPIEQISGIRGSGQFLLMVDRQSYMGPTMEGPWTPSGMTITEDMTAAQAAVAPSMAANVSEAECLGLVETDAGPRVHYRFRTQVDPHPARGDSWWGAHYDLKVMPDTGLPTGMELTEHVSSWHEGVKNERHVIAITYSDDITIPRPD